MNGYTNINTNKKTYKVPVTIKSATGAVQMQMQIKIMLWNNNEIMMKLS